MACVTRPQPGAQHGEPGSLVERLDLESKVAILTGSSAWSTTASAGIGLREMVMSDGPSGVRGTVWDERSPSLLLPCGTALAASWDIELAAAFGGFLALEARRKGVDVVLAPMINLQRSPLGGRNFEMFGEDPLLIADLTAAYVDGVQAAGVAACVKAYVANDFETDRYTADVEVSERALREVYLLPFEKAVTEAHVWCVMSAYNSVNGAPATESELLDEPLNGEWDFDGVVVSDWTAVRTLESARHAQDLVMSGPGGAWGSALVAAVRAGEIPESAIDRKVARILLLADRTGALDGHPPARLGPVHGGPEFARRAAADAMVLLRNQGALPLPPEDLARVAVIGDNARHARTQGGGSATVMPEYEVSPLEGIRSALPVGVTIDFAAGAIVQTGFAPLEPRLMHNPVSGDRGARVSYLDADGNAVSVEDRLGAVLIDFGDAPGAERVASVVFETDYTPEHTAVLRLGFASPGSGRLFVDADLRLDETISAQGGDQVGGFFAPDSVAADVDVAAGRTVRLRYEFVPGEIVDGVEGSFSVSFGTQPTPHDEDDLIAEAVRAAAAADTAVVVVGTNARVECEGYDRADLRLPGRQDDLVRAVAAANRNTVVVVNAGAAVEMPWRDDVAAIVVAWFGGQEFGTALADVLLGRAEPGGRLPATWPDTLADVPVVDVTPRDGVLHYDEGIHVGYRAWLKSDVDPAYPFGFGLGYTQWQLGKAAVTAPDAKGDVVVSLEVRNVGRRTGKHVLQVYARRSDSRVDRPRLWLVGFAVLRAAPGEVGCHDVRVPRRAFAYWDDGWVYEPGGYELLAGSSIAELGDPVIVDVAAGG